GIRVLFTSPLPIRQGRDVRAWFEPTNLYTASVHLLLESFLGVPVKARYGLAKRPPRRSRWRPSHGVKNPHCLRGLAPQSRFVAAHAVKQGRVNIGEAQETLGDGAGLRPWCERRGPRRRRQTSLCSRTPLVLRLRVTGFSPASG